MSMSFRWLELARRWCWLAPPGWIRPQLTRAISMSHRVVTISSTSLGAMLAGFETYDAMDHKTSATHQRCRNDVSVRPAIALTLLSLPCPLRRLASSLQGSFESEINIH